MRHEAPSSVSSMDPVSILAHVHFYLQAHNQMAAKVVESFRRDALAAIGKQLLGGE